MATRMGRARDTGATLLELLVVLLLIGGLTAIAVPTFVKQRNNSANKTIEVDLKSVAAMVETWQTDNPDDMDGPAAWNAPLSNYTVGSDPVPKIKLEPTHFYDYPVPLSFGTYIKIYANEVTASYCIVGAHKGSSRGWNSTTHPVAANLTYYNPNTGKTSGTASTGCTYRVGNNIQRPGS